MNGCFMFLDKDPALTILTAKPIPARFTNTREDPLPIHAALCTLLVARVWSALVTDLCHTANMVVLCHEKSLKDGR